MAPLDDLTTEDGAGEPRLLGTFLSFIFGARELRAYPNQDPLLLAKIPKDILVMKLVVALLLCLLVAPTQGIWGGGGGSGSRTPLGSGATRKGAVAGAAGGDALPRSRSKELESRQDSSQPKVHADTSTTSGDENDNANEAFAPLQVLVEVNGFMVPAIIDTGAQITVMSASCAKRCRISSSIDTRFSGKAIGVGSSEIIGRVDGLGMRVGPVSFEGKVSVLREAQVDFLIGLDLLKRFKTEVNLKEHVLKLQVRDRIYRVPLLHKNADLEVIPTGSAGAHQVSNSLEDPDYYESEFPEEDLAIDMAAASLPFPSSSMPSQLNSKPPSIFRSPAGARKKEPALSLEGV